MRPAAAEVGLDFVSKHRPLHLEKAKLTCGYFGE